ncbi:papain family cysteine protease containing protein [Nannochloropsis gaditana]|uniref:Papain family cysteine protease containing protein n=1 Tax=Nannochloropsis gaditana TaxID=72520 RepID=W7TH31_9STRA|nr:papain family cysteine protease containing protein [Nannochloropsis gaditana]
MYASGLRIAAVAKVVIVLTNLAFALSGREGKAHLRHSSPASRLSLDLEPHHRYTFEEFVRDFGKEYVPGSTEYQRRETIFADRLRVVQEHNAANSRRGTTFRKGVNQYSDWTDAELRGLLGFKPSAQWHVKRQPRLEVLSAAMESSHSNSSGAFSRQERLLTNLPSHVDWREKGAVTKPKNQGACGSCWTFSGVEAIESALWLSTGKLFTLSEQEFVSCTSNPEHCGGTGGCFGATQDILYEYVLAHGFTLERDYPYVSGNGSEPMCLNQPLHVGSIAGYVDLPPNDLAAHLLAVNSQPLAISLDASDFHNYHSGVLTFQDCGADLNHAVVLVGYGTDEETGIDFFLVRNSWGEEWGESGYIRLARSQECAVDTTPLDGTGCEGGVDELTVCGTCGMLFSSSYPVGAFLFQD